MRRGAPLAIAVLLLGAGCSGRHAPHSPLAVPLPRISAHDAPAVRAGKLARYIEARWPRIRVTQAHVDTENAIVSFGDQPVYDRSIRDADAYTAHVRQLTGDLAQASVELLQLSVRYFPEMRYASVWQDSSLRAVWTKEQIVAMDRPQAYRSYRSFLKLIFTAQYPPLGAVAPPAPTS